MQLSNLLQFSYWLDASVASQRAGASIWLVVLAGMIGCAICGVLLSRRLLARDMALAIVVACALLAAVGLGRLFAIPVLGWRIGWLVAGLIAISPLVIRVARQADRDGLVQDCLDAMAFRPLNAQAEHGEAAAQREKDDWHISTTVLWLAFNLLGTAVILANINLPIVLAPILLAVLLLPVLVAAMLNAIRHRSGIPRRALSCLSPLTIAYIIALINFMGVRIEGVLNGVLNLQLALIVMSAYAFTISVRWAVDRCQVSGARYQGTDAGDQTFVKYGSIALVIGAVAWSSWTALSLRTQGVTGSDPYAYAQMGIDLAERGTVFHEFPLVGLTYDLNISSYPISHVGYRIPQDVRREATTVWPPGYAIFTALAYRIGGETGIYLVTPLLSLISLLVIAGFALVVVSPIYHETEDGVRIARYAVAALTVFLTATSYQQVEWQMIPMADIAAQLFSILAITLAFTNRQSPIANSSFLSLLFVPTLSGLCLGLAFDIRYTQVLIAPAIALALWMDDGRPTTDNSRGSSIVCRLSSVVVCAIAAFIAALPVLIYHTVAFGSPFHTGSEELTNFSLNRLPETLLRTLSELNSYREFGLLTPLIAIGLFVMWRWNRRALIVLVTYFVVLFAFHIAYAYLRLRDLLFLFPVISLLAALGAVEFTRVLIRTTRLAANVARLATITLIAALSFIFVLRAMETLVLPITRGFGAFGYLLAEQRASFGRLRKLTPENAVIGCTLNSGAVNLHSQRLTFRPGAWQPDELTRFIDALHAESTPVFILEDGEELVDAMRTLHERYNLVELARLDVPYYFKGSGSENRKVPLYEVRMVGEPDRGVAWIR